MEAMIYCESTILEWPKQLEVNGKGKNGLSSDSLCYMHSYLKDRKQCVQINNKQSEFDTIISCVP